MRLFNCQHCDQVLYFENTKCERCGHRLGYLPHDNTLSALEPQDDAWQALAVPGSPYRFCANAAYDACNWLVPTGSPEAFCMACRHNRTVPDLSVPAYVQAWRKIELAKHRLFYTLLRLRLPLQTRAEDPEHGLAFDFLADPPPDTTGPKVLTGHDNGLITLALVEADDAERERRRVAMGEPYRTLLGHFRHELGHHYWDLLVRDQGRLEECRAVFGDDSEDYEQALKRHYARGVPANWRENYVSAYATTHAWEDFAETWAHYLHIVDTLEMAAAFGLSARPKADHEHVMDLDIDFSPYKAGGTERLIGAWLPLTFALNSINRCMGERDLYPFILSPAVIRKIGYIHDLVHAPCTVHAPRKA